MWVHSPVVGGREHRELGVGCRVLSTWRERERSGSGERARHMDRVGSACEAGGKQMEVDYEYSNTRRHRGSIEGEADRWG